MIIPGLWLLGKNTTKEKSILLHIISRSPISTYIINSDINFGHLINIVSTIFLHYEITVFSFLYTIIWKQVTKYSPQPKQKELDYTL